MLKFHPALVIAKVVLLIGQVFGSVQGPYLYGMPALGFLLFLPLRTKSYAHLSVKDAILWKLQLQFSFISKTQSCWHVIFFDYFFNLQMWFQILFNWWHSPLAWWHSQELKFKKSFEINNQFVFSLASFEVRISIISSLFIFNKFFSRTSWDPANYNNFELRLVSSMPQLWDPQRMLLWTIAKVCSVWFILSIHKFQV